MASKMQAAPVDEYDVDLDQLDADTKRGPSYWRPKLDDNTIRIIPFPNTKGSGYTFYIAVVEHFNVGTDNHTVFCPEEMQQKACAVCNENRALRRSPDADDQKIAKDRRAKVQYFSPIVDLSEAAKGVQIYQYGPMVMADLADIVKNKKWGSVFSPVAGRDWTITKRQKGKQKWEVEYSARPDPEKTPIADESWLEVAADMISEVVTFPTQAQVKVWLEGASEEEDEEEETTASRRSTPVDDDEEEKTDEYAPVETPATTTRTASKPRPSGKAPTGAADKLRSRLASLNRGE